MQLTYNGCARTAMRTSHAKKGADIQLGGKGLSHKSTKTRLVLHAKANATPKKQSERWESKTLEGHSHKITARRLAKNSARHVLFVVSLALTLFIGAQTPDTVTAQTEVKVTFYTPTGNVMRSGVYPFSGAASCSPDLSDVAGGEYRRFILDGRVYQCLDTGGGVLWRHVDLFCWSFWEDCQWLLRTHGEYGTIVLLD